MNFNIQEFLENKRAEINSFLNSIYQSTQDNLSTHDHLVESIKYSLNSDGKRLRPILCMSTCEVLCGDSQKALVSGCAIEMIHTYSLIHDDLPSMDNDQLRRGKPTNHIVYGEATAILAGDALLSDAFNLIASEFVNNNNDLKIALSILLKLSEAIGSKGMVMGQSLDLQVEGTNQISVEKLKGIHSLKTGKLIEASIEIGALLGNANNDELKILNAYSQKIGLSFQIADDILDIVGSDEFGKNTGSDAMKNKPTYASILGVDECRVLVKTLTEEALNELENLNKNTEPLRSLAKLLSERAN